VAGSGFTRGYSSRGPHTRAVASSSAPRLDARELAVLPEIFPAEVCLVELQPQFPIVGDRRRQQLGLAKLFEVSEHRLSKCEKFGIAWMKPISAT
jgi:hypothetical protein